MRLKVFFKLVTRKLPYVIDGTTACGIIADVL